MGKWDYNPSYKGKSPFITGRGPPCTDTHQIQISQVHPIGIILLTKYPSDFFGVQMKSLDGIQLELQRHAGPVSAGQRMYNVSHDVFISQ